MQPTGGSGVSDRVPHLWGSTGETEEQELDMATTPQGIEAERQFDLLADKFKKDIIWVLTTQGPTSPAMLHPYLSMVQFYSPEVVREAMWRLLDDKTIELMHDMKLKMVDAS